MTDPKALIDEARVIADAYDAKKWEAGEFMPQGIIRRLADALERAEEALERDANDERYHVGYSDGYDAGWDEADAHYTKTAP